MKIAFLLLAMLSSPAMAQNSLGTFDEMRSADALESTAKSMKGIEGVMRSQAGGNMALLQTRQYALQLENQVALLQQQLVAHDRDAVRNLAIAKKEHEKDLIAERKVAAILRNLLIKTAGFIDADDEAQLSRHLEHIWHSIMPQETRELKVKISKQ